MSNDAPVIWSQQQRIVCPECGLVQEAMIERYADEPWPRFIHDCVGCGYTIMESEWDREGEGDE